MLTEWYPVSIITFYWLETSPRSAHPQERGLHSCVDTWRRAHWKSPRACLLHVPTGGQHKQEQQPEQETPELRAHGETSDLQGRAFIPLAKVSTEWVGWYVAVGPQVSLKHTGMPNMQEVFALPSQGLWLLFFFLNNDNDTKEICITYYASDMIL